MATKTLPTEAQRNEESPPQPAPRHRINVVLGERAYKQLQELGRKLQRNQSETIRWLISTGWTLAEEKLDRGNEIVLVRADKLDDFVDLGGYAGRVIVNS